MALLGPGSIAFTGFNADGNDNLAFVALQTIPTGTVIYFQDNEWTGSAFNTGEGVFSWTAAGEIAAGTVVTLDSTSDPVAVSSNHGTVTYIDAGNPGYSNGGEIVYAFVGSSATAPTAFLAAVASDGLTNGAVLTGTGLVAGQTALEFTGGIDIAGYTGPRNNQASFADYATQLNTASNYTVQDGGGDQSVDLDAPNAPFPTDAFTVGTPDPAQTVRFASSSLTVSKAEGDTGGRDFVFTVERTGGTTGDVNFSVAFSNGATDAADFTGPVSSPLNGTIQAGQTSATVTLHVASDTSVESSESFSLDLQSATNTGTAPTSIDTAADTATGTILNDDAGPSIGGIRVFDPAASLAGSVNVPTATNAVSLTRLGDFVGSGGVAAGRAESIAFSPVTDKIYVSNAAQDRIDVAQIGANGAATATDGINLSGLTGYGEVNSVAVKGGILAVAYQNAEPTLGGYVAVYDTATQTLQASVQVGVLPDQLTFTPDGHKILAANEGEAISSDNNPAGSISIIDVSGGTASAHVVNTIGFSSLNGEEAALANRGLATFPGQAATGDIEPEYISVSADGTRAYVTLQEVNAVAVIDLTDGSADRPLSIQPLGGIDRSLPGNQFDPNDQNGVSLVNKDVMSLPQPDAIASFQAGGQTYFVTANEGDARVGTGLLDEVRLSSGGYVLDPTAYPDATALKAEIGRLNVLNNVGDTDGDGDYDQIYTFGGRGISIFRQNSDGTITKVRETGGEFERIIAGQYPTLHNTQDGADADNRSDNKGPEPEGVDVGVVGGRTYAFVALERVGGVMIYDVTNPASASFVGYKPATANDYGPEVIKFISAADSPTGQAMVVTANEISGYTTIYSVADNSAPPSSGGGDNGGGSALPTTPASTGPSAGADSLPGQAAAETVAGGAGDDTIDGAGGSDTLDGDAGNDSLTGGSGGDNIRGLNDNDGIDGGDGNDTVNGNLGSDTVRGGEGNDFVYGGRDNDQASGGAGDDAHVNGNIGSDIVHGDDGNDTVYGGQGGDSVYGDAGDDRLSGDLGNDILFGGQGADRFAFAHGGGQDWVGDFDGAAGDRILLSPGTTFTVRSYMGQVQIDLGNGDAISLTGVSPESFNASAWVVFG